MIDGHSNGILLDLCRLIVTTKLLKMEIQTDVKRCSAYCCVTYTDCQYGDRQTWCSNIGVTFPLSSCVTNWHDCCHTCHTLMAATSTTTLTSSTATSTSVTTTQNFDINRRPANSASTLTPATTGPSSSSSSHIVSVYNRDRVIIQPVNTGSGSAVHVAPHEKHDRRRKISNDVINTRSRENSYNDDDEDDETSSRAGGGGGSGDLQGGQGHWYVDNKPAGGGNVSNVRRRLPAVRFAPHRTATSGTRMDRVLHYPQSAHSYSSSSSAVINGQRGEDNRYDVSNDVQRSYSEDDEQETDGIFKVGAQVYCQLLR